MKNKRCSLCFYTISDIFIERQIRLKAERINLDFRNIQFFLFWSVYVDSSHALESGIHETFLKLSKDVLRSKCAFGWPCRVLIFLDKMPKFSLITTFSSLEIDELRNKSRRLTTWKTNEPIFVCFSSQKVLHVLKSTSRP